MQRRKEVFSVGSIRVEQRKCFVKAFTTYMQGFMHKAVDHEVIFKRTPEGNVYFEFNEGEVIVSRYFEEDIVFSYNIAIQAIYEYARKTGMFCIMADEDQATVKAIKNEKT